MKFTDSPVIDLTVNGTKLSIQQDNGSMHVGTSVWPCSLILSKFAERWSTLDSSSSTTPNPYAELFDFRRRRGVELGTGCGVAVMAFHLLGLTEIVLTDIAPVMPALKHNLKRNKAALGKSLKASVVYWNNRDQISALNPPFDLVIAADVVYIEESVGQLVTAMELLLADDGAVLLGYQIRSPEADKLFWEMCDVVFRIEKVPHEHLHHEYAYEETDVYIFRKKVKKVTEAESES
ncbi:PREDICTED: protein N-lysine methyltransferase METTL21A-like [Camelina sativa]|uniref:Protein N-lysine methyltransferase METTL21A-like n=1 Tax=Camelina sativa TaxID=90675 RepID=A0ABM0X788_CAMSA|nr:PREDICTED: protein N-lysine methyltransferase METTL21A-like [Camelina sativa]